MLLDLKTYWSKQKQDNEAKGPGRKQKTKGKHPKFIHASKINSEIITELIITPNIETRGQCHNIIKNTQGKKDSQELSSPTTASPKYFNIAEEQENDLQYNLMKMTEVFREGMKKIP